MLLISFGATALMSLLYVQIMIYNRKKEIITLKCIGWTNKDIRTLLLGEVMWVTLVGFLIVFEILIHHAAITSYYWHQNLTEMESLSSSNNFWQRTNPFLSIPNIMWTLLLFIASQLLGVLVIYKNIAKLRPIVTMRVMK
jgi:ABC-type antimicrobial peptide transport system permease subunit